MRRTIWRSVASPSWAWLAAGVLALSGCATTEQKITAASAIKVTDDSFRPFKEYATGPVKSANDLGVGAKQLVGRIDRKTGALTMVLQFQIIYVSANKRRYDQARNARAQPLPFHAVQQRSVCARNKECTFDELFVVTLPEAELRATGADGYPIKAFAKNGPDVLVSIPRPLIASLFERIDADRGAAAATAANPAAPSLPATAGARHPRT